MPLRGNPWMFTLGGPDEPSPWPAFVQPQPLPAPQPRRRLALGPKLRAVLNRIVRRQTVPETVEDQNIEVLRQKVEQLEAPLRLLEARRAELQRLPQTLETLTEQRELPDRIADAMKLRDRARMEYNRAVADAKRATDLEALRPVVARVAECLPALRSDLAFLRDMYRRVPLDQFGFPNTLPDQLLHAIDAVTRGTSLGPANAPTHGLDFVGVAAVTHATARRGYR